jgi:hypothetical protein
MASSAFAQAACYGVPAKEIARICHVSLKTAGRWKAGTMRPPKSALFLLVGDLGCFDSEWAGWSIRGGVLYSPEGCEITMRDALASSLTRQQLAAYKTEIEQLREVRVFMNWLGATLGRPIREMVGDGSFTELTQALLQQVLMQKAIPMLQQVSERAAERLSSGS